MNDYPIRLQFSHDERNKLLVGMRHEKMLTTTPYVVGDCGAWRDVCVRIQAQLEKDGMVMVLGDLDVSALAQAVTLNPLGFSQIGSAWTKISKLSPWMGFDKAARFAMAYGAAPDKWGIAKWYINAQQMPRIRGWRADAWIVDDMLDAYGTQFKWPKPKFTIKDALDIKKHRQEERNEAMKKFNPDPTKRRKR